MGLFDFLKPKKGAGFDNWHAETDLDKFSGIELSDVESYASRIDDMIYDFVILTPPEPVDGCETFAQAREKAAGDRKDNANGLFLFAGLNAATAVVVFGVKTLRNRKRGAEG